MKGKNFLIQEALKIVAVTMLIVAASSIPIRAKAQIIEGQVIIPSENSLQYIDLVRNASVSIYQEGNFNVISLTHIPEKGLGTYKVSIVSENKEVLWIGTFSQESDSFEITVPTLQKGNHYAFQDKKNQWHGSISNAEGSWVIATFVDNTVISQTFQRPN